MPSGSNLGLVCEGVTASGCTTNLDMHVGEVPSVAQGTIEHGGFQFGLSAGNQLDGGAVCSTPGTCGLNQFDVRIERLPAWADAGD
jgi:hypothetical protein